MTGFCKNCDRFTYEGEDTKGHCSWYGSYYYPYNSCDHWTDGNSDEDDEDKEDE